MSESASGGPVVEWRLEDVDLKQAGRLSAAASLVAIIVGGYVVGMHVARGGIDTSLSGLLLGVAGMVVATGLVLVVHEATHGLGIALSGARPVFGTGRLAGGQVPYLYAGAPGHHFSPRQFLTILWAPSIVVNAGLLAAMLLNPWGVWLIIPFVVHVSGCFGDWLMIRAIRGQDGIATVEDTMDGMRLHLRESV